MKIHYDIDRFEHNPIIEKIAFESGILYDTACILYAKNIDTVEKAEKFLHPSKKNFYNPLLLRGMKESVERIIYARDIKEKVLVFGDYDADGACAVAVLSKSLSVFGIDPFIAIPEREDGYGINEETVDKFIIENNVTLLITVDCGVSDREKIERIKKKGVDVIVTDHHEPPEILPDCVVINPKIKGQDYPFTELSGAGVAYKLSYALIGEKANAYLDFVALATVADNMELTDENRDITHEGLKLFNGDKVKPCFKYLYGDAIKKVTAERISYNIAPRVNAGGRMGDANCSLKLFTETDQNKLYDLAVKLNEYNILRQEECDRIYKEAKVIIERDDLLKDGVIVVANENWQTGLVGIVASKIADEYNKPTVVFAGNSGEFKGSARSGDGVSVYDIIASAKDLLTTFGGHKQAAGVGINPKDLEEFRRRVNAYLSDNNITSEEKTVSVAWEIDKEVSVRFGKELETLEPFGSGNKKPCFSVKGKAFSVSPLKSGSPHYTVKSDYIEILDFNGIKDLEKLKGNFEKDIVIDLTYSEYRGVSSVKGILKKIVLDKETEDKLPSRFEERLKNISKENLLSLSSYNLKKDRETFVKGYNIIKSLAGKNGSTATEIYYANDVDFNPYQFVFCFAVFSELGFIKIENDVLTTGSVMKKDLTESTVYSSVN